MSDYLWDKTGEPDSEVERLEELLGAFAHGGGALELPPEAATHEGTARKRFAWLAVAAALLLAALAGVLVALRPAERQEARQVVPQAPQSSPAARASVAEAPKDLAPEERASADVPLAPRSARAASPARAPRETPVRRRAARPDAFNAVRAPEEKGASGGEVAATLGRGFSVKSQLVNALFLTSEKLREVQRKTQGPTPPAFTERSHSR